mmetsp:Transcript_34544/g.72772  ORF Transcript_34544/g.72772 Transcript_34544/m.72772 type:complete len:80 (+) Transcript_34544:359-598(+)
MMASSSSSSSRTNNEIEQGETHTAANRGQKEMLANIPPGEGVEETPPRRDAVHPKTPRLRRPRRSLPPILDTKAAMRLS